MSSAASPLIEATERAESASLECLYLRDFRNFEELRLELPGSGAMIVGPNGSGKTNFLEAIYYLEVFRSFRGARDAELVRFGTEVFRVEGTVRRGAESVEVAAAYDRLRRRKRAEVHGAEVERIADALGTLGAVVLSLEDTGLVSGSPARRRRFLDILLSLARPGYLAALQRYRAVLAQRNEALRQGAAAEVEAWSEGLVEPGARVMAVREAWVAERSENYRRYHAEISGGTSGSLAYEPGLSATEAAMPLAAEPAAAYAEREAEGDTGGAEIPADAPAEPAPDPGLGGETRIAAWAERLRSALKASAERDRRRGATQVGPHRDDLVIRAAVGEDGRERDLRAYGSGGQQRTAAIALRLSEADTLRERLGRDPIYLLDDVFAELDAGRAGRVLGLLEEGRSGQVFLTAPKPVDLPLREGRLARWRIRDGVVRTDE